MAVHPVSYCHRSCHRVHIQAETNPDRRFAIFVLCSGVSGYFLALGTQGPVGALYRYAYFHIPGFQILREPEKFSMLIALCYRCGFGWGVNKLAGEVISQGRTMAMGVLCLALPFAYTPNLLFGLGGQIRASSYPASWQTVARLVRGSAPVLFLPWHEYQAFPFTTNRVVNTPAEQYFPAPILESQDAGPGYQSGPVDPEVSFVSSIVEHKGPVANAGALLSAIGVRLDHSCQGQRLAVLRLASPSARPPLCIQRGRRGGLRQHHPSSRTCKSYNSTFNNHSASALDIQQR